MNPGARRAVFLDRDGVLNRAVVRNGRPYPPASVSDVEILPGVEDACRRLADAGWTLIVVTNQPDVARGATTAAEVDAINATVVEGLNVTEVLVCAHDDTDGCGCRKPLPGLLTTAAERWDIDLAKSVMVGDRWRDIEAGRAAGVATIFVDRGYDEKQPDQADHVVGDLSAAADVILSWDGTGTGTGTGSGSGPGSEGSESEGSEPDRAAPDRADDWDAHWAAYADAVSDNPAQEYRRQLIIGAVEEKGTPTRLLDIGSGQGDLIADLAQRWPDAEYAGLELSEEGTRIASAKTPSSRFFAADLTAADSVPVELRGWADVAVCSEVLEHVDDPAGFLRNAIEGLAPGGLLVVTVPGGPRTQFDRFIGHRRHFKPADLRAVLEAAGLEIQEASGTGFPFFNVYKTAVLLRGRALVQDVSAQTPPSRTAAVAMKVFGVVLTTRWNSARFGWQLAATARRPSVGR